VVTYPPNPLPLLREGEIVCKRDEAPLLSFFPLSILGEGEEGGEVDKTLN
jgi:hypothetical protein